uniref:Sodium/calcium exchanger membrane region domain-containing protein n=1 Tax=Timema genevievae TaxID=629358 RepID=A0A7R9JPH4_TIMGE|nr:unnamed protein product [Timema genevievae]
MTARLRMSDQAVEVRGKCAQMTFLSYTCHGGRDSDYSVLLSNRMSGQAVEVRKESAQRTTLDITRVMTGSGHGLDDQQIFDANCTPPAIDDFPRDLFSERQRQDGAVVLHVFTSLYLFVALAVVCDKYFVPAVERICQALNMSNDVAGATFMAAATSAPELFVNVIGTFITEGDIGVGTIVGSAVFNILAVAACCGIGAGIVVPLDWWPLTRDCLAYGVTVSLMICIIHDERVEWYQPRVEPGKPRLVDSFIDHYTTGLAYTLVMYWDKPIQQCTRARLGLTADRPTKNSENCVETGEVGVPLQTDASSPQHQLQIQQQQLQQNGRIKVSTDRVPQEDSQDEESVNRKTTPDSPDRDLNLDLTVLSSLAQHETSALANYATEKWWKQLAWLFIWPIHLVFLVTIPDCEKPRFKKWFPLTFIMCIIWIGSLSYVVAWMITIIGDTLKIPDSVMGITFLAAGTSVPEAVSSVIVAKQGHGSMGISNSIGSNTFDILLCLGLPWLIKASFLPAMEGQHFVRINSRGLEYSAISLLSTLMLLYATFSCNRFQLDRKVGQACLLMYAMFLVLASLIELNVFFKVNLPTCGRWTVVLQDVEVCSAVHLIPMQSVAHACLNNYAIPALYAET